MNECDRCQRTFEDGSSEFEHGCEVVTHHHGPVFVCELCMHPGEHGEWRQRRLIEQIAERTVRRILAAERTTTA